MEVAPDPLLASLAPRRQAPDVHDEIAYIGGVRKARGLFIGYAIIALVAGWPILSVLAASFVASWNGCPVHEGFANRGVVFGANIGGLLYSMGVLMVHADDATPGSHFPHCLDRDLGNHEKVVGAPTRHTSPPSVLSSPTVPSAPDEVLLAGQELGLEPM